MSICYEINQGFSTPCEVDAHRYVQRIVIINRKDVDNFEITSNLNYNRISFTLKANRTGFAVENLANANHIDVNLSRDKFGKNTYYNASVSFFLEGASEEVKAFIKQIDGSEYFLVAKFGNDIEVIGFDTNFENNSSYNASGSLQTLSTKYSSSKPPYIYKSVGNAIDEFNNNFSRI